MLNERSKLQTHTRGNWGVATRRQREMQEEDSERVTTVANRHNQLELEWKKAGSDDASAGWGIVGGKKTQETKRASEGKGKNWGKQRADSGVDGTGEKRQQQQARITFLDIKKSHKKGPKWKS